MKIFKLLFPLLVMLAVWPCKAYGAPELPLNVMLTPIEKEDEEPDKGKRCPTFPTTCVIDFSSLEITFSEAHAVISYELWDEEGTTIIASYDNDHEMVMYLANLSGCYQLRLVTDTGAYIGYLYL